MGGNFAYAPTMVARAGRQINIFGADGAGGLHNKSWDGANWNPSLTDWEDLGGALAGPVAVVVRGGDQLSIFGVGTDGHMKCKWWDGNEWGPWSDLDPVLTFTGEPSTASFRGNYVSLIAVGTDGHIRHALWNGSTWWPWQDMGYSFGSSLALFRWIGT